MINENIKIVIFDFDETIINSRQPTKNHIEFIRKKYNLKKRLDKWWDSTYSLLFDYKLKEIDGYSFNEKYQYYKQNGYKIFLLSSRLNTLEKEIKNILDKNNIIIDEYYLRDINIGSMEHKILGLEKICNKYNTKDITIYDDTIEVINEVEKRFPFIKRNLVPK